MRKKIFFILSLFFFVFFFIYSFFSNSDKYTIPYDPQFWEKKYLLSQWTLGWEAKEQLSDAELYAYNGWVIIKGGDPIRIDATVPPLGKYFIGLSILLFKNQNVQALLFGLFLLITIFLTAKRIFKNSFWALLPVLLFSVEKIFSENLTTSMLDLPFALFISLGFYFLTFEEKLPKFFLLTTLCFAFVSLTKMFLVGFALYAFSLIYFFYLSLKKKDPKFFSYFFLSIFLFKLIYLSGYYFYFKAGHSFKDFFYYHFWLIKYAKVTVENYPKGEIFNILFFGRWKTWWGEGGQIKVSQWNLLWPISFLFTLYSFFLSGKNLFYLKKNYLKKREKNIFILSCWPLLLLIMYATGVPYPRYLLPILPPLYILFCYNLEQFFQYAQKK